MNTTEKVSQPIEQQLQWAGTGGGELVRVAPELAGLDFPGAVYSLDLGTREVRSGAAIAPGVLRRLPAWSWAQVPARSALVAGFFYWLFRR